MTIAEMLVELDDKYSWWKLGTGFNHKLQLTIGFYVKHNGRKIIQYVTATRNKKESVIDLYKECRRKIKVMKGLYE